MKVQLGVKVLEEVGGHVLNPFFLPLSWKI